MMAAGIAPITIEMQQTLKQQPQWLRALQGERALSLVDLLLFTRQMGTMVKAGVPMLQSLDGMLKSTTNRRLIELLQALRSDLDKGIELSSAMAHHPEFFNDYYVSMVRVGEGTGKLEEVFRRLFEQLEFDKHMKQKIKNALRYPSFVLTAIAIAVSILAIFVIPTFAKVYSGMHVALPLLTRFLLAVSGFAVNYWWAVLAAGALAFYVFRFYVATHEGRYSWDKLKLRFPVVGNILVKATISRFCSSFATASRSGVPIVQAFTLVSRVVDNAFFEQRILQMREGVERGESLLRVAQSSGIFTPLELQMISVGEDTGEMDAMLEQVADMYQEEVNYEVGRLSETIEPLLLAAMGVLVLILLLGIFLPMWDLTQMAHHK
jgi:MSHA biogenesis protein MshG